MTRTRQYTDERQKLRSYHANWKNNHEDESIHSKHLKQYIQSIQFHCKTLKITAKKNWCFDNLNIRPDNLSVAQDKKVIQHQAQLQRA